MISDNTGYLKLPLPHKDNYLEDDVPRLRDAFNGVDLHAQGTDWRLDAAERDLTTKADAAGTDAALLAVGQRLDQVAAELAGGIPTLSDAVDSAVSSVAASSKAVKMAFDKGVSAAADAAVALGKAEAAQNIANASQNAADVAKDIAGAAQNAIANVNPYKIGDFKSWHEQIPPPGWAVRNGAILSNADQDYPDLWRYLQRPENTWKCKTLSQWNSLSSAAGWTGGVPFFVVDISAKTIKLPDTRGDYTRDAGSNYLQSVGAWHNDAFQGHKHGISGASNRVSPDQADHNYDSLVHRSGNLSNHVLDAISSSYGSVRMAIETRTRCTAMLGCVCVRSVTT